jgi:ATP-dependent DNA ligase
MEFPILKIYTKDQKVRFWKIRVKKVEDRYLLEREYGIENGKLTKPNPLLFEDEKKAMTKAKMLFRKKMEEGFREEKHENLKVHHTKQSVIRPMGAHKLDEFSHKLKYPVFVQKKLDGYRCLANWDFKTKSILLHSRTMKLYSHLDHIREELKELMEGEEFYLDGELYNHEMGIHEIGSFVRKKYVEKENIEKMKEIEYCIFDMFDPKKMEMTFKERYQFLEKIFAKKKFKYLKLLSIVKCSDFTCIEKENEKYLSEGYEGVIVRNVAGFYQWNKKSYDVLRTKEFKREKFLLN